MVTPMTGLLIGLVVSAAGLVWAVVSWRVAAARHAKRKKIAAAERAIFAETRGVAADPPRRSRIEFGRR